MRSYLEAGYLEDTGVGAPTAPAEITTAPSVPTQQPVAAPAPEMVQLPGGLTVSKKTLTVVAVAALTVFILWFMNNQKKK